MAGAAHISEISLTLVIHRGREAQLDQVRNWREVAQHVERTDVRVVIRLHRESDGTH